MDFDPARLRGQLPALHDPLAAQSPPAVQAYRDFYQLPGAGLACRLGQLPVAGRQLAIQVWWPAHPRASLLLMHGYFDHMGLYRHLIDWALGQGLVVLTCDLPGHGLSEGAPGSISDFAEYQQVLQRLLECADSLHLPPPWHLCGQSTGAAIIVDHLLAGGYCDGHSLLLSPLVRPCEWMRILLTLPLLQPFTDAVERIWKANSNDPAFLEFLRQDPLQIDRLPLDWVSALRHWVPQIEAAPPSRRQPLLVQGDADTTVEWRHNLQVLEGKFDQPPRLLLHGARHHLVNESPELRRQMFAWLAARLG